MQKMLRSLRPLLPGSLVAGGGMKHSQKFWAWATRKTQFERQLFLVTFQL